MSETEVKKRRGRPRLTEEERQKSKEKVLAKQTRMRATMPDVVREYRQRWYANHKDELKSLYQLKKELYLEFLKANKESTV